MSKVTQLARTKPGYVSKPIRLETLHSVWYRDESTGLGPKAVTAACTCVSVPGGPLGSLGLGMQALLVGSLELTSSLLEKSAHVPKSSGEDLGVERLLWLLGGWEPRLHRLLGAFALSWTKLRVDLRAVAQDEAPLRGREEPGGGTLTARHAGKGNPRGARTATERRRLQHGVGAQLSALPGALLLSALLTFPPALRGHQTAEELGGQYGRGAPARAPLPAPGALGLLPRASGVTGAARTLAGGHGTVRAPGWGSASILWPHGRPGSRARLGCLAGRLRPWRCLRIAVAGSGAELLPWPGVWRMVELRAGQAGVTRDRRLLRCNAPGVQRFKSPLTLLDRRPENSGFQDGSFGSQQEDGGRPRGKQGMPV
ncbi:hypothetical protein R6Z07M_007374 [Ovis aries]